MLNIRVYLERSHTGLWYATLCTHQGPLRLLGYLDKVAARNAAEGVAMNVYGRIPYYMET